MLALVSFFTGPLGRWVLVGLAFVAWTVYQRDQAADRAREECQAEQLQKTLDEMRRQRDAAEKALAQAEAQEAKTAEELDRLREEYDAIRADLGEIGTAACVIPDAVRQRLHNIQ